MLIPASGLFTLCCYVMTQRPKKGLVHAMQSTGPLLTSGVKLEPGAADIPVVIN